MQFISLVHVDYSSGVKATVTVQVGSSGNKAQVLLYLVYNLCECNGTLCTIGSCVIRSYSGWS